MVAAFLLNCCATFPSMQLSKHWHFIAWHLVQDKFLFQNKAKFLRLAIEIDGCQLKQRIKPLYEKYDFLNINQIHFYEVAKLKYYCVHRLEPAIFDDCYKFVTNVRRHRLRSVDDEKLYLPLFKKKPRQNSIKYKGVKIWNSLPKNIRTLCFMKFKKSCRQYVKNIE